jgi:hypothetical protein
LSVENRILPARAGAPRWVLLLFGGLLAGSAGASGFCDGQRQDGSTTPQGGYCHQVRQMPPPQRPAVANDADGPTATLEEACVKPLQALDFRFRIDAADSAAERVGSALEFLQLSVALQPTGEPPGTSWSVSSSPSVAALAATQGRHLLSMSLQRPAPPAGAYVELDLDETWPAQDGGDISFDRLASARLDLPAQAGWMHARLQPLGDWSGVRGSLSFEPDDGAAGAARSLRLPAGFGGAGLETVIAWPYRLRSGLLGGEALRGDTRSELNYYSLSNLDSSCLWN